ncbi:MAG: crossover junction endodeoxyribonuclease RuvC [Candidatus Dormibacteraeota bacterium]|uniref:Crossover junction endodeoxyribonuclease RuvC n=1 Tax=Candidatus Amunia macphersoniae TaxID=3127014 RepID=A0A934KNI2_9BACT|nr:crossover junction endodeoxyribonuclease RuvC [Candidatus Dormibacteraeota bacterium]
MRVLGIDPGLGRTGVAVVDGQPGKLRLVHATCLETRAGSDAERLHLLFGLISTVIDEHRPSFAAVERLFFSTNRATAMRVAEARGVLLCALAGAAVPVAEYTPNEVKESVAGYGAARKPQVLRMTMQLLSVDTIEGPDDVADACAIAVCHHHRASLTLRVRGRVRPPVNALDTAVAAALSRLRAGAR